MHKAMSHPSAVEGSDALQQQQQQSSVGSAGRLQSLRGPADWSLSGPLGSAGGQGGGARPRFAPNLAPRRMSAAPSVAPVVISGVAESPSARETVHPNGIGFTSSSHSAAGAAASPPGSAVTPSPDTDAGAKVTGRSGPQRAGQQSLDSKTGRSGRGVPASKRPPAALGAGLGPTSSSSSFSAAVPGRTDPSNQGKKPGFMHDGDDDHEDHGYASNVLEFDDVDQPPIQLPAVDASLEMDGPNRAASDCLAASIPVSLDDYVGGFFDLDSFNADALDFHLVQIPWLGTSQSKVDGAGPKHLEVFDDGTVDVVFGDGSRCALKKGTKCGFDQQLWRLRLSEARTPNDAIRTGSRSDLHAAAPQLSGHIDAVGDVRHRFVVVPAVDTWDDPI